MRLSKKGMGSAISVGLLLSAVANTHIGAMDLLEKRECTVGRPSRAPVHTRCVISGGIQGGTIDISIKTPDDKVYALEGPIDGEDGHKFLLEHHPASKGNESDEWQCYRRNDAQLELCIAKLGSGKNPGGDGVNKVGAVSVEHSPQVGRRSETNSPMRRADPRGRVAVQQVILRQRPSQVCDTNIQGDAATIPGSGVPAGVTVFGDSDYSNDDSAKRKHREHSQPNQGRS
jgi:hypothetical protein